MRITPRWMVVFVVTVLFGGILVSMAIGEWTTRNNKVPRKFTQGEYSGQYDPADIRGSYTFGDISRLFEIPLEDLAVAFRIEEPNVSEVALKTLEEKFAHLDFELGTGSVKLFTALYTGYPYDLGTEDAYLLPEAVDLLKQKATLNPDQLAYLDSHTISEATELAEPVIHVATQPSDSTPEGVPVSTPSGGSGNPEGGSGTPNPKQDPEERKIAGKTTFQDMLDWGVTQADIEKAIGQPLPSANLLIKDWATAQGLSFSILKEQLQVLVDGME